MNITSWGKNDEAAIAAFEYKIGFALPNDYRQFLLNNNGGVVNDQTFFVEGLGQEVLMDVFYGIAIFHGRTLNIDYWLQEYKGEIGGNELVIGRDPGGHQLLYITEGEDKGIYYWDANHFLRNLQNRAIPTL